MTNPKPLKIYVRYLGIFRLMSGRKEDVFQFTQQVSLAQVLEKVNQLLPNLLSKQLETQTLMLSSELGQPGRVIDLSKDSNILLADGNCVTVVTPVTGG